jgi:hypothetical protein
MVSDERAKLRTFINYLIEHNREHSQEVREWADKAEAMGEAKAAGEMLQASQAMDKSVEHLSQSLRRLEEA